MTTYRPSKADIRELGKTRKEDIDSTNFFKQLRGARALDLSNMRNVPDELIINIANVIARSEGIHTVNMSNSLRLRSEETLISVFTALATSHTIHTLLLQDLNFNGPQEALAMAGILATFPNLRFLDLTKSLMSVHFDTVAIIRAIMQSPTLQHLILNDNPLSPYAEDIFDILANATLLTVTMVYCNIEDRKPELDAALASVGSTLIARFDAPPQYTDDDSADGRSPTAEAEADGSSSDDERSSAADDLADLARGSSSAATKAAHDKRSSAAEAEADGSSAAKAEADERSSAAEDDLVDGSPAAEAEAGGSSPAAEAEADGSSPAAEAEAGGSPAAEAEYEAEAAYDQRRPTAEAAHDERSPAAHSDGSSSAWALVTRDLQLYFVPEGLQVGITGEQEHFFDSGK